MGNKLSRKTELFWALLIAGIVALVSYTTGNREYRQPPLQPQSAEQLLAARFARGEISESEYRDRLAVLRDHAQHRDHVQH